MWNTLLIDRRKRKKRRNVPVSMLMNLRMSRATMIVINWQEISVTGKTSDGALPQSRHKKQISHSRNDSANSSINSFGSKKRINKAG